MLKIEILKTIKTYLFVYICWQIKLPLMPDYPLLIIPEPASRLPQLFSFYNSFFRNCSRFNRNSKYRANQSCK